MGKSIVWIIIAVLAVVCAGWLSTQVDVARAQAREAQQRERLLIEQLQQLATRSAPSQSASVDADTAALAAALGGNADLIPFEGVLGGSYYFVEESVEVLSDRYLYAACEDGHVMCHMLLAYDRDGDAVSFEVIDAYQH